MKTTLLRKTPMQRTAKPASGKPKQPDKRPKGLKTRQLAVTATEKAIWSKLAEMGCIACMKDGFYNPHVSIHHVDGRTNPGCHMLVLPLCGPHHQEDGSGALAVHPWKARFEQRYGAQLDLVKQCMAMIGEK